MKWNFIRAVIALAFLLFICYNIINLNILTCAESKVAVVQHIATLASIQNHWSTQN